MTGTDIRELDAKTVERIAAGEVVERPASVVKELVENALDAGASRVAVAVEDGGTGGVTVRDDGHGMTEADVRASVREHTTSKIRDVDDLEAGVSTLGFRGEALHTIGAVSRMTIRTRPHDAETGTELVYAGGEVESVSEVGCPAGTTIEVVDLFYNTPAREKYLKTTPTEFAHVNRVVRSYALANPEVAVSLEHDGREVFATPGRGDRLATVMAVYGREVAEAMHAVDDVDIPEGPLDDVHGLVSDPETNRSAREYVSVFVNGRAVSASAVREAVIEAYGGQLDADRYPFTALFLDVPAGDVDVNVHPRKMEVRFADEAAMKRQVRAAVEETLLDAGLVRSSAPRGRSKRPEAAVEPTTASDLDDEAGDADAASKDVEGGDATPGDDATAGTVAPDASAPVDDDTTRDRSSGEAHADRDPVADAGSASTAGPEDSASTSGTVGSASTTDAGSDSSASNERAETESSTSTPTASGASSTAGGSSPAAGEHRASGDGPRSDADGRSASGGDADGRFGGAVEQRTLTGETATPDGEYDRLPSMRVLGQYRDTYLVAETDDGLVLVDQHAADERVNYERLRAAFEADATAQALAEPVTLELTAGEAEAFPAYREALATLGFHAERTDDREVTVTTVPAVFDETLDPGDVRDVLSGFVASDDDGAATVDALADAFVADLACYPSVTANTSLTEGSVVELLAALDDCENPFACPHGRPTVVRIDHGDLEDRFERDYPGHAGRREL
ncbi:DNA mismatch repair endonuclease MutL [Halorubellus salinus]|uniref:DNA mismatch repair endonuclease MutL n=1 Tax=Halorubellus salinus TaxID=755309 RepID=UPI001D08E9D7|nr:DNA mismatch repair endonuclease MutL [Halorubellus salinus]